MCVGEKVHKCERDNSVKNPLNAAVYTTEGGERESARARGREIAG